MPLLALLCCSDRTARLWSTDRVFPLRLFVGHRDDVDAVVFHPNCQYLATGGSDCSVRLWDVSLGSAARLLLGHAAPVTALCFEPAGRHLFSASADGHWMQFDISSARVVAHGRMPDAQPGLSASPASASAAPRITSLAVSSDGELLAAAGLQGAVSVWSVKTATRNGGEQPALQTWRSRQSAMLRLHFTPRNLLLAAARFQH